MGKSGNSLRSPWISISKVWRSVESLALTKLGNGSRTSFCLDIWVGTSPLKGLFSLLYKIALLPQGSVVDHWDFATLSWSLPFRRSLKDVEIVEFESLLSLLSEEQVLDLEDHKVWSIDPHGCFTVKSLSSHLHSVCPIGNCLFKALWKSSSPWRVNILIWVIVSRNLNNADILQKKAPNKCFLPSVCPLCLKANETSICSYFSLSPLFAGTEFSPSSTLFGFLMALFAP